MLAVVLAIALFLSFASFSIPSTFTNYNGFFNSIRLGFDLQGGASVVFEASMHEDDFEGNLTQNIEGTISRIELLLESKGYNEHYVYKQGNNKIVVEVPVLTDTDYIFDKLNQPANFKITKEESSSAEALLTGKHIKNAGYQVQQGENGYQHGVAIVFNNEGTKLFAELTKELSEDSGTMYIYVGEDTSPLTRLTSSGAITNGVVFISSDSMTEEQAKEMSLKILSGSFSTQLKMLENKIVSASLGQSALNMGSIAIFVIFALSLIYMVINFKQFGLLAAFSSMFFMVLSLFFLQAVPFIRLTMSSFIGIIAGIMLNLISYIIIYNKIKQENVAGKKLYLSAKQGQSKALPVIADMHAVFGIFSLVLIIFATGTIKGFAASLLITTAISAFCSLLIFKFMLKNYLVLNSSNVKKFNLPKMEKKANE
jgi:protein-export membrane protein SecD